MKRIKLDSRSLAEKSRKAPANDDASRNDEQELIIIITCGTCNYPNAWNHRREDRRERRASHTTSWFSPHSGHQRGLTVPRENIPRE